MPYARVIAIMRRAFCLLTLAVATPVLLVLAARQAWGQTIDKSDQVLPERFLNNRTVDLRTGTRPSNLNPGGISYDDCRQDMTLEFRVNVSDFLNSQASSLEVWATNGNDCVANATRAVGGSAPTCWLVYKLPGPTFGATQTISIDIPVRDIVGPQNAIPLAPSIAATKAHGSDLGLASCSTQPSFTAVPMFLWFLAIDSGGNSVGHPYQFGASPTTFITDLVGPPAPIGVSESVGDTLFKVGWTANSDSDTAGYDVFIDPIPGQEGSAGVGDGTALHCYETGAPSGATDSASESGGDDASGDGDDGTPADAADGSVTDVAASGVDVVCVTISTGGPPSGSTSCNDSLLSSAVVQDGSTTTTVLDEAGNVIDSSVASGSGGISSIPPANLLGAGPSGLSVSDRGTGSYTITGLKNGNLYNVVVSAVDGLGNIGPPTAQVCDTPAPVNDFWNIYRQDGGRAGGGLCALEAVGEPAQSVVGLGMIVGTSLLAVRRRYKRPGRRRP